MEARNCFPEGTGAGTLKCITGFNHYGVRNKLINNDTIDNTCPRCGALETWEHVVKCDGISELKQEKF